MIKRQIDFSCALLVILYLRMSSDRQNPRSPEQQQATIEEIIKRLGYPWKIVAIYIDRGVSGRVVGQRPEFQRMLRDIRTGAVRADAILVDTYERFGRAEELQSIRRNLRIEQGVLVLTADTGFADPTDAVGHLRSAFESVRATEDNRIKAHNVLRGKRDAALQKHWPGGPAPFGYRLESVLLERGGRQEVSHSILTPNPETTWIMCKVFAMAAERGWGGVRIAKDLNDDPKIPENLKPFYAATIDMWLDQEIYTGVFVWPKVATDIISDHRVTERVSVENQIRVEGFCEPLIPLEVWQRVQAQRSIRSKQILDARSQNAGGSDKTIKPLAPGIALKYPLSGLVRCDLCGLVMTASSSSTYVTKAGEERRYVGYVCPANLSGACDNDRRVPEEWLCKTVFDLIAQRLFPPHD